MELLEGDSLGRQLEKAIQARDPAFSWFTSSIF
jgi:hypothetical protein